MNAWMKTVVGIDLSLTSTGIARIDYGHDAEAFQAIAVQTIGSKGHRGDTLLQRHQRLVKLARGIAEIARGADLVVIEAPAFSRSNPGMHDRSGLWWLVIDLLENDSYTSASIVEIPPTIRAKYATGKGNAGKDEVLAQVVRRYPTVDVRNNDEADALVLAAIGTRHLGHHVDDLPLTHLAALAKVAWPEKDVA